MGTLKPPDPVGAASQVPLRPAPATERPGPRTFRSTRSMDPAWPRRPVAIVAPLYAPATGGVERYVERLALGLQARGVALEILTTDPRLERPTVEWRDGVRV